MCEIFGDLFFPSISALISNTFEKIGKLSILDCQKKKNKNVKRWKLPKKKTKMQ